MTGWSILPGMPGTAERASVTILFTDVVGSTAYFERYGDTLGVAMIRRHDEIADAAVSECGGRVIKTIGDAVMAEFPAPAAGVRAAIVMQRRIFETNQQLPEPDRTQLRIGIHHGSVIRRADDLYGDAVNLTARLCKLCGPAQIVVSRTVGDAVRGGDVRCQSLGSWPVSGKSEREELFEVVWTDAAAYQELRDSMTAALARGDLIGRDSPILTPEAEPSEPLVPARNSAGPALIGRVISHYRILDKLGEGGMGVVYKAEDLKLKRTVALKFLSARALADPTAKARLIREAQAAGCLDHPNICHIYGLEEAEGLTFIVMAYVEGTSLARRLSSGLTLGEALDLAIQVGEGLKAAHAKGIVHRDVKAANIVINSSGVAQLTDFGLARVEDRSRLTNPGTLMGTVASMAPEQVMAQDADLRADIWAVGVMLYEMCTGRQPFERADVQRSMQAILHEEPKSPATINPMLPSDLERLVRKTLAKQREERYQHMDELVVDMRALRRSLTDEQQSLAAGRGAGTDLPTATGGKRTWLTRILGQRGARNDR